MSKKVVPFGEIMMCLTPPDYERFIQTDSFNVIYGGGEANASVSLANYEITIIDRVGGEGSFAAANASGRVKR